MPQPVNYGKMVELAEKLSAPLKFARIDFYEINGKIYFGEITFFPGNGMEEWAVGFNCNDGGLDWKS